MIKLIIFDLDGVLIDTEEIHYSCLISACLTYVGNNINILDLIKKDGTSTKHKLNLLKRTVGLDQQIIEKIDLLKQEMVLAEFSKISQNNNHIGMLSSLLAEKYILAVGSNSRKQNVNTILSLLGIKEYFSTILSGDSVIYTKPNPEIFTRIMEKHSILPRETLILEDSSAGVEAVYHAGAHLLKINSCTETTFENIKNEIYKINGSDPGSRIGL